MSISGVNSYTNALFQWQGQQLKGTGQSSSKNSSGNSLNELFGTSSMTGQLSSMVELTKYAMDAMGLGSDSRVTFSQITKYREQLQAEFSKNVKDGLAGVGISDLDALTFHLGTDGTLTAVGSNAADRKSAQAWLDANPSLGKGLRKSLTDADIEAEDAVYLRLGSSGKLSVIDNTSDNIQSALNGQAGLSTDLRTALGKLGVDLSSGLEFTFNDDGNLAVKGDVEQAEAVNKWLEDNPQLADAVKKELEKNKVDVSAVQLRLGNEGPVQISVNNSDLKDIQAVLDRQTDTGKNLREGLQNLSIDPNIKFTLQVNKDGSVTVVSDHADRAKVQKFFEDNPDLIKKYKQIETLSGLDDARKAMQISPSEMRKRIQIESMSAWWSGSGNANSYFGNYAGGNMSLMSGLNLSV